MFGWDFYGAALGSFTSRMPAEKRSRTARIEAAARTAAAAALATVALAGCDDARTAYQECTIGLSQALPAPHDEHERLRQEIVYASTCMFQRGYVLDAERQRRDAASRRVGDVYTYWVRR